MRLLLDENLPHKLRHELPGHDVATVTFMGWDGTRNGELLKVAADAGFHAMLTMDSGYGHQHNLKQLRLSVIVIRAASNDINLLRPFMPVLLDRLGGLTGPTLVEVDCRA